MSTVKARVSEAWHLYWCEAWGLLALIGEILTDFADDRARPHWRSWDRYAQHREARRSGAMRAPGHSVR